MASENTIATAYIQLVPTLSGVQGAVGQAFGGPEVDRAAEDAGKRTGSKWGGALTAAAGVAAGAAAAGGAALAGLYKIGSTFDDVADSIQLATGKTGGELDALTQSAKNVGTQVPVEFEKIGPALASVSQRLGLTGSDLETVTSQFLALGEITGKDLNMDQATASFNAFGIKGADVATQMDNLFKVSQATGTGIDEITGAIQKSAPALQQLGFGFQESAALVGQLDKAGLNTQGVLGGMGKALVSLAKDGEAPQEAFQRVTGQIGDLVKAGDDAKAIDLASTLFGTKGATQFVEATKNGTLNVDAMTTALADNQTTILGAAEDTADFAEQWQLFKNKALVALEPVGTAVFNVAGAIGGKLNDALDVVVPGLQSLFHLLGSGDFDGGLFGLQEDSPIVGGLLAIRDAAIEIGGVLGGAFKDAWDGIWPVLQEVGGTLGTAVVDMFKTLWPEIQKLFPIIQDLLPVLNPVQLIFKALLPILPQIAAVVGDLGRTLANILAKALEAVAPLFQKIVDVVNRLLPFLTDLVSSLLPPLVSLFDSLSPLLDAVLAALVPVVDLIIDLLIPAIDALMPVVQTVFGFIAETIANAITIFKGLIDVLTGIFTGDWEKVWTGVKEIFGGIWDQIKNIFGTLWELISNFFTNLAPAIWEIVSSFAGKLAEWGGQFLGWLWDGIKGAFAQMLEWFGQLAGWVWEKVVAFAGWMKDRGSEFITWLWNGIVAGAQQLWDWFTSLPGWLWDKIAAGAGFIYDRGSEFIGWLKNGIEAGAQSIWDWFTGLPQAIWNKVTEVASTLVNLGKQFVGWIVEGIGKVANDIWTAITDAFTGQANTFAENPLMYMGQSAGGGLVATMAAGGVAGRLRRFPNGKVSGPGGPISDVIPTLLSNGEYVVRASKTAEFLPLLDMINYGHMAEGGLATYEALRPVLNTLGANLANGIAREVGKAMDSGATGTANVGAMNNSYDPSSFGWVRAANINPDYRWNGYSFPGGVARGTEGLWNSLLTQLVPQIPGGLGNGNWGYENRSIAGSSNASFHSYGLALDINAPQNGRGLSGYGRAGNGVIPGEVAHNIAASLGMQWGGDWSYTDPMHFEIHLAPGDLGVIGAEAVKGGTVVSGLVAIIRKKLGLTDAPMGTSSNADPAGVAGGMFDPLVERWRGTVEQALTLIGQPLGLANTVLNQIRSESSGDPRAINLTDSNARKGTPSKGLIQAIDPTFQAYRLASLPNDVYNPLANIVAGIRYAISRYGSIIAGMRGVAYDDGGWLMPWQGGAGLRGTIPMNMMREPEPILTRRQWDIAEAAINDRVRGVGSGVEMTVYQLPGQSPADLAREVDRRLAFGGALT